MTRIYYFMLADSSWYEIGNHMWIEAFYEVDTNLWRLTPLRHKPKSPHTNNGQTPSWHTKRLNWQGLTKTYVSTIYLLSSCTTSTLSLSLVPFSIPYLCSLFRPSRFIHPSSTLLNIFVRIFRMVSCHSVQFREYILENAMEAVAHLKQF